MLDGFDHPAPLSVHYTHFDVANRLFLTGHSHQAWPDVALEGQRQAWLDAAEMLDGKWSVVAEKVEPLAVIANIVHGAAGDQSGAHCPACWPSPRA